MSRPEHTTATVPTRQQPASAPTLPPTPDGGGSAATRSAVAALRVFCRGLPGTDAALAAPDDGFHPALLLPYRDPARLRHDYPLFLAAGPVEEGPISRSLGELLATTFTTRWPEPEAARLLHDNLLRLERHVRDRVDGQVGPVEAIGVAAAAADEMRAELALKGSADEELAAQLAQLVDALPPGRLVPLDDRSVLWLLLAAAEHHAAGRHARLRAKVADLAARLRELVRLDEAKGSAGGAAERFGGSVGETLIDPQAIARMTGSSRGAPPMTPDRRDRIDGTIETLQGFLDATDPPPVTVVAASDPPEGWTAATADWRVAAGGAVCREAAAVFDERATAMAGILAAIRVATLELANRYDPARHDALRSSFDWRSFSTEELGLLPVVAALESTEHFAGDGLRDLSRLLRSGRPIQTIVPVQAVANPGAEPSADPLEGHRFELGSFGLGHREAFVQQSSAARPAHLLDGLQRSLDAPCPALHVITGVLTASGTTPPLGAWLHAGAALEGRAHPFFHYDPSAGVTWARRFEIGDNPASEDDWPADELACVNDDGGGATLACAFTFADFVLLDGGVEHFRIVPPSVAPDHLVPLADYVGEEGAREADDAIPFVWAGDAQGRLHRLAVGPRLVEAGRDRLAYWRTLQELAGVRNEHVREAVERERQRAQETLAAERDRLERERDEAVEAARRDAAREAFAALAQALVSGDPLTVAAGLGASPSVSPGVAPSEPPVTALVEQVVEDAAEPEPAPEPDEEEPIAAEPWIDSPLCTSCNDCIQMNPKLFVYNGNKQAIIGDPRAGTYRQLVEAAEKCPARCIHPGLPADDGEPDVEKLVERAKPFL